MPHLADTFHAVLADHTAGSPVAEEIIWTDLTATDIAARLREGGNPVSVHIVEQLLQQHDYHRRKAQKDLPLDEHKDRDAQFHNIARFKQEYLASLNPLLSIDTKKRELLGTFYRAGRLLTTRTVRAFDHDFPSYADGVVIPHGLYDLRLNRGYLHLGTSHDTSAFACDCLADWWWRFGQEQYPGATSLLLLCDGGGSNSANTYLFKADVQALVNQIGLEVRVAHYPPYTSKYNPIEHRLFCHVTRACQGMLFRSLSVVKQLMEKTQTRTGLRVVVDVLEKVYETGRKVAESVRKGLHLIRDLFLPKWNYRILPQESG
jgi:Rhodopirellula transposase DDE domain